MTSFHLFQDTNFLGSSAPGGIKGRKGKGLGASRIKSNSNEKGFAGKEGFSRRAGFGRSLNPNANKQGNSQGKKATLGGQSFGSNLRGAKGLGGGKMGGSKIKPFVEHPQPLKKLDDGLDDIEFAHGPVGGYAHEYDGGIDMKMLARAGKVILSAVTFETEALDFDLSDDSGDDIDDDELDKLEEKDFIL